ncbi:MAG: hypothetical protein KC800_01825 [Candidatus Eremiobacteraeota bacterium]|nr:hypothetical protein [Candidatus Eremiobacteraeota bacterium]
MNGLINTRNGVVAAPGLKARGAVQNARYQQGVQSGELTGAERVALRGARRADRAHLAAAKEDGSVSGRERIALHRDMNQTSRLLAAFKHN